MKSEYKQPIEPIKKDFQLTEEDLILLNKTKKVAKFLSIIIFSFAVIILTTILLFIFGNYSELAIIGCTILSLWLTFTSQIIINKNSSTYFVDLIYDRILTPSTKKVDERNKLFETANLNYKKEVYAYVRAVSRRTWEFWLSKTGEEFEEAVADLFIDKGFTVFTTPKTGDGGIDVLLEKEGKKTVVQCKLYKKKVSPNVARELYGTMIAEEADDAILVAPRGFSEATKEFVAGKPIQLYDIDTLTQMMFEFDDYVPYGLANATSMEEVKKYLNRNVLPKKHKIR